MIQKLGLNKGAYYGDQVDAEQLIRRALLAAEAHGWNVEMFAPAECPPIYALRREGSVSAPCVYISAGIHGDEPAGLVALVEMLEERLFPTDLNFWICPCLNPSGFPLNRRHNAEGIDLNREYHAPAAREIRAHIAWLEKQPRFDTAFCLHEDWESGGFYLYEINLSSRPSLAEDIIEAVSAVCPIDLAAEIEGRPAFGGVIRPSADPLTRPQWPEAFYLLQNKTQRAYTLEAPSDFVLGVRVVALKTALNRVLKASCYC